MEDFFGLFSKKQKDDGKDLQDKALVINRYRCPENHPCPFHSRLPHGRAQAEGICGADG